MAKALFFSLPMHGHVNPSLPLVRELVARGDDVTYFASEAFRPQVERTGARYRPYRNDYLRTMTSLPVRTDELSWLLMRTAGEVLDVELSAVRAECPDYVLTDSVAPWGQWMAAALDVPLVTSVSTFAINRSVLLWAASHGARPKSARLVAAKIRHMAKAFVLGRQLRRRYRVNGPGVMASVMGRSDLNIVYTSRLFQPRSETFDARYEFIGPSITDRLETDDMFSATETETRPIVYISLGTLFNRDVAFYRSCFAALQSESVRVVLSTGTHVALESLGAIPANFVVRAHVPQLAVLQRAATFVTHGGMNSVSESLYYGVPVAVVPQMAEQEMVGRRVAELGAGVYLAKADAVADTIRAAVRRLLAEDQFRDRARALGESLRATGGVSRAADAIWAFTGRQ